MNAKSVDIDPSIAVWLKRFVISAGLSLGFTALAKLWSAFGDVKLLAVADPITGLSFRNMMLVAAVAELPIAAVCLFTKANRLATMLVAWIATNFLVYRLGLWWIGWKKPCSCLGNLTDTLHISPQTADMLIKVLLAYLLIGSYALLIWQWRTGKPLKAGAVVRTLLIYSAILFKTTQVSAADLVVDEKWKSHFKKPPVITNCVFERVLTSSDMDIELYQARYQENAFLIRRIGDLSDASLEHIAVIGGYTGRFGSNYWAIDGGNLKLFPDADGLIRQWATPEVSLITAPRRIMVAALFFGLYLLDPSTVEWVDDSVFVGSSFRGDGIHARILEVSNGLPTRFGWFADSNPDAQFVTELDYRGEFDLHYYPSEITVQAEHDGERHPIAIYRILALQVAREALSEDWFSSSRYYANSDAAKTLVVTNNALYVKRSDGQLVEVINAPPPGVDLPRETSLVSPRVVILGLLLLSTISLLLIWKRTQTPNRKEEH